MIKTVSFPPRSLLLAAGFVSAASLIPIVYLTLRTFSYGSDAIGILTRKSTLVVLLNSLCLATCVTISAITIGIAIAWLTVRTDLQFRRFWAIVTPLPLALPSYVGAFALLAAIGPRGFIQGILEPLGIESLPSVYGFLGSWGVLTLFTYPYVLLCVRSGLRGHDPALEEVARSLGHKPRRIFWEITLPNLRPSIIAGALLVILYVLSDFGVVSMLQFDSFTRKIYIHYTASFDPSTAAVLSFLLVILTLIILAVEYRFRGNIRYYGYATGSPRRSPIVSLGKWRIPALLFCASIVFLALVVPLAVISFWLYRGIASDQNVFEGFRTLFQSVSVSIVAATVAVIAAFPVVFISIRYPGWISNVFERCAYIGHALPGIVIALALVFFGIHWTPFLYQTLFMLVFAYVIRFLPEAIGSLRTTLVRIDPNLEEAARNLGRSPYQVLKTVTFPLLKPGLLAGIALVFLNCIKELPATLLLSPTGFQTLATRIWGATEEAFYARAAAPALLLVLAAACSLSVIISQMDKGVSN